MKTRYDFIVAQKTDLVSAKTSLEETMKEIETTASEKFLDAFTKVKANFISVFQKLFTEGDQCDLYLENPDDVLESKIEVVAKPKGKKPSTITQLSGGEKTLTAIALLFSLYLLKPAPFCILDEVDAPLDDANVGRFNELLKETGYSNIGLLHIDLDGNDYHILKALNFQAITCLHTAPMTNRAVAVSVDAGV